jgi:cellulose synthase operon protein C
MRYVNLRLLGILTAVVVVVGVGIWALHKWQINRNADVFKDLADLAKQQGDECLKLANLAKQEGDNPKADGKMNEARKNYIDALRNYGAYESSRPDDWETSVKRGDLLAALGDYGNAVKVYEKVLRQFTLDEEDPKKAEEDAKKETELRHKLVELVMGLGENSSNPRYVPDASERSKQTAMWYGVAKDHIQDYLIEKSPDDGQLLEWLGICQSALGENDEAAKTFETALEKSPQLVSVYGRLVTLLWKKLNRVKEADSWMEKLISINPESYAAYLMAINYAKARAGESAEKSLPDETVKFLDRAIAYGPIALECADKALTEAEAALKAKPDDADLKKKRDIAAQGKRQSLIQAAQCSMLTAQQLKEQQKTSEAKEQFLRARAYIKTGIEEFPKAPEMYLTMAEMEQQPTGEEGETSLDRLNAAIGVLRQGLEPTKNNPELLWQMGQLLLGANNIEESEKVLDQLRKAKVEGVQFTDGLLEFMEGRIYLLRSRWREAIDCFEKARRPLASFPDMCKQVDFLIGRCHAALGNPEQERAAYRRALQADPRYFAAQVALEQAMLQSGEIENVWTEYKKISKFLPNPADAVPPLAEMLLRKNLQLNPDQRDWSQLDLLMREVEKDDSLKLTLLRSDILVAKNRIADAEALLRKALENNPDNAALWVQLISLAQRKEDWADVERLLVEAQGKLQSQRDKIELKIARARYLVQHYGTSAARQIQELAELPDGYSDSEQLRLWGGLFDPARQINDTKFCLSLCERIATKQPQDIQVRFVMFDMAFQTDDRETMDKAVAEIRRIEGEGPYWHYCEGMRLERLVDEGKAGDSALAEAIVHLDKARQVRPNWSPIYLGLGLTYDKQGQKTKALESFRRAIDLGARTPYAIRRTIELLNGAGLYAEALNMMRMLEGQQTAQDAQLESKLQFNTGDLDVALDLARKTAASSKSVQDHVWLAHVLEAKRKQLRGEEKFDFAQKIQDEEERALRFAVDLDDKTPETWMPLVELLALTDRKDEAQQTIRKAAEKLPPALAPVVLAQCYAMIGEIDAAQDQYVKAVAAAPSDPILAWNAADFFYNTGRFQMAEEQLRRILDGSVKAKEDLIMMGRRRLAEIYRQQGDYAGRQKALELLEKNLASDPDSVQDKRDKALILAQIPGQIADAAKQLDDLSKGSKQSNPEDKHNAAKLYLAQGNWSKFVPTMTSLLAGNGDNPKYLTTYVGALVDREPANAEPWLKNLESLLKNNFTTVRFRAILLVRTGKPDKALALLKDFIDMPNAQPAGKTERIQAVAEVLCELVPRLAPADRQTWQPRFIEEAQSAYLRFVQAQPDKQILMVSFLAQLGKIDDALNLLENIWQKFPAPAIATECQFLQLPSLTTKAQFKRGEEVLLAALKKYDRQAQLLMILATSYAMSQQRYAEAETLYREVLTKDPKNLEALNNLAMMLVFSGTKLDEALKYVNRAMEIAGPRPDMLDTRGTVYLAQGKTDQALADLKKATTDSTDASRFFHLAQACDLAGNSAEAAEAMKKTRQMGINIATLALPEQQAYQQLQKKYLSSAKDE